MAGSGAACGPAPRRCRSDSFESAVHCAEQGLRPVVPALPRLGGAGADVRRTRQRRGLSRQPDQLLHRQHLAHATAVRAGNGKAGAGARARAGVRRAGHPVVAADRVSSQPSRPCCPRYPGEPQPIPPETYDHVVARPNGGNHFVTSDQCMGCHSGNAWMGSKFVMIVEPHSSSPVNVSPYGEWRWSPMGLAGRDPIFFAQLESEVASLRNRPARSGADGDQRVLPLSRHDGEAAAGAGQWLRPRELEPVHQGPDFDPSDGPRSSRPGVSRGARARRHQLPLVPPHCRDRTPAGRNPLQHFLDIDHRTVHARPGRRDWRAVPPGEHNLDPSDEDVAGARAEVPDAYPWTRGCAAAATPSTCR